MNNLAAGLVAMGFKKGDRVGIWGPNMREWVITQFATAKAGLILVSPLYKRTMAFIGYQNMDGYLFCRLCSKKQSFWRASVKL